jgi:hypothetical protein
MELEMSAEAKDKRLNRYIAMTVVTLSVFVGLCHIKDENIVQAMERSEAHAIDSWNEYQANKTKQHLAENARVQLQLLGQPDKVGPALGDLDRSIAKYKGESPGLADQAHAEDATYDRLNFRDDQFDAADASISTAISLAAVAALLESFGMLFAAWGFGAFGVFMGLNGFFGWPFHPAVLSTFLG